MIEGENNHCQRFPKAEHLCSHKLIEQLYAEGHRLRAFPFVVQWMETSGEELCQVMIVVPKKRFKHAVDRNHLRRLTRECYRKNKHILAEPLRDKGVHLAISMVYSHNEMPTYKQLEVHIVKMLTTLANNIQTS